MKPYFVYSKHYDFLFSGLNKLHPFDTTKFSKAWNIVADKFKDSLPELWIEPTTPISDESLLRIHTQAYLDSLKQSKTVAQVIEIPAAKLIPNKILQNRLIKPIRLACEGTLIATKKALRDHAMVMNFGGGFHHAFADHGEGFCFFADAALAILDSREKGLLGKDDKVLMIDLDAHRGNGFEAVTQHDKSIQIFDMYNFQTYPGLHPGDPDEFPYMVPLKSGTDSGSYLDILHTEIEPFFSSNQDAKLAFYNAGNDILENDPLGGLKVDFESIMKRDQFIIESLVEMDIPTVIMTSGGYTKQSHFLIAEIASKTVQLTPAINDP